MMQTGDKFLSVLAAVLIVLRHIALASEPTSTAWIRLHFGCY